nr:apolipoprotein A1/A4/E family protein [Pseudomonadota bacterium]
MAMQKSSPVAPARIQPPQAKVSPQPPSTSRPTAAKRRLNIASLPFWLGLLVSVAWVSLVFFVIARSGPARNFGGLPLADWAIGVSAIVSPIALVWMVAAYLQRASDVQSVAEPLRRQLMMITGESGAAEARIRRFNQAVREQVDLLRSAQSMTQTDLVAIMDRVRSHKGELEKLEQVSIHQVKDIQDIIRRNMQQVEQMMDDKFTMMRILDDKLVQNGDGVARQIEAVRDHVATLLEEIESNGRHLSETLARAMQDSKKLSDTSRAQENSLITAAESAADTLGTISGKIDLSVARFMERAGIAREEAERLAGALDVQTRALDEFSNTLPTRVSEAESVLRGVADRLYASEQLAREQAVNLSEKLSVQLEGLQQFMDRFGARLSDIDGNLQQRHTDLDALGRRIGDTTEDFVKVWENSVDNLGARTEFMLSRFASLNEQTQKGADHVSAQLSQTVEQYETTASRMRAVSDDSAANLKAMTMDVVSNLSQFEALRDASRRAGEEVQERAAGAMQNFQHVLERLLVARDAMQSIGGTLVKDLHGAVDQNENLIGRLNEAAQMSVRALGIATESLGKQEGALASQTRSAQAMLQEAVVQLQQQAQTAELGLREQAGSLMALLAETQNQMSVTDEKLQSFAARSVPPVQEAIRQIDVSAEQGLSSMGRYSDSLQEQFSRLQQFNGRMAGMGDELGRVTADSISSIEQLNARFMSARTAQEETVQHTLAQFNDMADRLQREVAGLDGQTSQAVVILQQAASRVGEQSYQLLQNAENSGAKMQLITSALQNEAAQIRTVLQKQADDLGADLS